MRKIKRIIIGMLALIAITGGASVPAKAKHLHRHRIRATRRVRIKRYRHHKYSYHHKRCRHHKRYYHKRRYRKHRRYKRKPKVKKRKKRRNNKRKTRRKQAPKVPLNQQDINDINNDRKAYHLKPLIQDPSLQKIANDRVLLAYKAWQNNWNSHGSDGKTATAAQLAFNTDSKDYNYNIKEIGENNALSYLSVIPATDSMVDGRMNYFPPEDVSTPSKIIDTNNDIYMNHDVGADGRTGHRNTILDQNTNAVGAAVYNENGCYVQNEVFGYVDQN